MLKKLKNGKKIELTRNLCDQKIVIWSISENVNYCHW